MMHCDNRLLNVLLDDAEQLRQLEGYSAPPVSLDIMDAKTACFDWGKK
jgi:hypothetical protein